MKDNFDVDLYEFDLWKSIIESSLVAGSSIEVAINNANKVVLTFREMTEGEEDEQ